MPKAIPITLYRTFAEDHRTSMDVYADALRNTLQQEYAEQFAIREYIPSFPNKLGKGAWGMRFARYGVYPFQAARHQGAINHILDHGYGHLLYQLDPARTIVTVHDIIPILRWQNGIRGVQAKTYPWLNQFTFNALCRARHLIAISENTRRDLIQYCHCQPEKISVIYYGIENHFRVLEPDEQTAVRRKWNLAANGTWRLLISGSQSYKNNQAALEALARLKTRTSQKIELLKVGAPDPHWNQAVEQLGLESDIRYLGSIPPMEMPEIYNCADVLVFPSWYEGFGRPPLEAMKCGIPVVASNAGALPESVGEAGMMIEPQDYDGLADAIHRVLTDTSLRQSLIEKGLARVKQFTWQANAAKTVAVYEQLAS